MQILYSKKETAAMLDISLRTLERLVENGYISSTKIGRQRKFSESHINKYIAKNEIINV